MAQKIANFRKTQKVLFYNILITNSILTIFGAKIQIFENL